MRHRRKGRVLGRNPSHRRALFRNLASALFLTEREEEDYLLADNVPKVKGRIVTTTAKAKEVRGLVEKCITIAKKSLPAAEEAEKHATTAERGSSAWETWRKGEGWQKWAQARSPVVAARRRCLQLLGDKEAVEILFEKVAPRFEDRPGGYTRIIRLPNVRLGDAGEQVIFEFVGENDRVTERSAAPAFEGGDEEEETAVATAPEEEASAETEAEENSEADATEEAAADEEKKDE